MRRVLGLPLLAVFATPWSGCLVSLSNTGRVTVPNIRGRVDSSLPVRSASEVVCEPAVTHTHIHKPIYRHKDTWTPSHTRASSILALPCLSGFLIASQHNTATFEACPLKDLLPPSLAVQWFSLPSSAMVLPSLQCNSMVLLS